jgi:uncharacterized membrane protein YgdD (TMEM256/DUF423 family)
MSKWILAVVALCGLTGAAGVVLAGVAAHGSADPMLGAGSRQLMFHTLAALGVAAVANSLPQRRGFFLAAAVLLLAGGVLFAADLAAQALLGSRLFPMAAPLGATLSILGWAWLTLASLVALARPSARSTRT